MKRLEMLTDPSEFKDVSNRMMDIYNNYDKTRLNLKPAMDFVRQRQLYR